MSGRQSTSIPVLERLLSHIVIDENGCWIWPRGKTGAGYGQIYLPEHRRDYCHRVAYIELVGPIADRLVIDHLCRVKACCNPDHLEPVTTAENIRRGKTRSSTCFRGHDLTDPAIVTPGGHCRPCQRVRSAARDARKRAERLRSRGVAA